MSYQDNSENDSQETLDKSNSFTEQKQIDNKNNSMHNQLKTVCELIEKIKNTDNADVNNFNFNFGTEIGTISARDNLNIGDGDRIIGSFKSNNSMDDSRHEYNLENPDDWNKFVLDKKTGNILALAIILCLFEYVPLSDIEGLKSDLCRLLPRNPNSDESRQTESVDIYLSQEVILSSIGGELGEIELKSNIGIMKTKCVRLKKNLKALDNFWSMYPVFRKPVIMWLKSLIEGSNSIIYRQAQCAFTKIIKLDFSYSLTNIIPDIASSENYYAAYYILYPLLSYNDYNCYITKLFNQWEKHVKLWRVTYLAYCFGEYKGDIINTIQSKIQNAINGSDILENPDIIFIAKQLHTSENIRNDIACIMYQVYKDNPKQKYSVVILYFTLVYNSFFLIDKNNFLLPLVTCDSANQLDSLTPIIFELFQNIEIRSLFFNLIEIYMINHEKSDNKALLDFFIRISFRNKLYFSKTNEFLKSCNSHTAIKIKTEINQRLNIAMKNRKLIGGKQK